MTVNFVITGGAELAARLRALPDKVANNLYRRAMPAGAKEILGPVRKALPRKSGRLVKSARITTNFDRSRGRVSGDVKVGNAATFYLNILAKGAKAHVIKARRVRALMIGTGVLREVHHPGIKGRDLLSGVLAGAGQKAVDQVTASLKDLLNNQQQGGT